MSVHNASDLQALTMRLRHVHGLSDADRVAVERLPLHKVTIAAGGSIVWAGEPVDRCVIVLGGMAHSYKLTGDGQRQILAFHLAGDMPDLEGLHFGRTDTGMAAMTACHVAYVPANALRRLWARRPGLADVLWRETLLQAAVVREWLLNVGRRDALAGLAHLLCEMVTRHRAAGLASGDGCPFPVTQAALGDALGLSTVHVNRMVKKLRQDRLIEWDGRQLAVSDWERLCALSDFDPSYLCLDRRPHAS